MAESTLPRPAAKSDLWSDLWPDRWPELAFESWHETCATLHRWVQIVGKIRLAQTPALNHCWHAALYLTARGLTTLPIAYDARSFQIDFDFIDHKLLIATSDGIVKQMALAPRPVADFYKELFSILRQLGLNVRIHPKPNELPDAEALPLDTDLVHAAYDADYANRFWRALMHADLVFKQFRARFLGKASPVHLFWGSFDLAATRFSGRSAPPHPGGVPNCPDNVMRDAYSHELSSCGFWPGSALLPQPVFYAYAYPEPPGYGQARVPGASYNEAFREFILPYEDVRRAQAPEMTLLNFLQGSYEAAANLGHWDRAALERPATSV